LLQEIQYSITMVNHRIVLVGLCLWLFLFTHQSVSAAPKSLKTPELEVLYEDVSRSMAEEVVTVFPDVKEALKKYIPWDTNFNPTVILLKDRRVFLQNAGGEIFLAYAVPRRYLIVLDASRVYSKPFTLETTLKHELCHLLLHHNIAETSLPRWLDEGICQWASGGISELLATDGSSALAKAIVADRVLRIRDIETFPKDEASIVLAYEESKNLIEYINNHYGRDALLRMLNYAREGYAVDESIQKSLAISLPELERTWHTYLRGKYTWFSYLSNNLYIILFLLGGVITIYGFLRFLKKKREYVDEEEDDGL
jgi:Peptidase MA superfamily